MHEMSLAEGVLQIVEQAAKQQQASRIKEVTLEIGALSGVEVSALEFCLDAVFKRSVAEGATFRIEHIRGQGYCLQCANTVEIAALFDACPTCGSYQVQPTAGKEMRVKDLLIE